MKNTINFFTSLIEQKSKWLTIILPVTVLGVLFYLILINNVYTQTYEIERFNRAKETIRSPITIENEAETERKMRETVLSVGDRYTVVEEITEEQINYIEEIFDAVQTLTGTKNEKDKTKNDEKNEQKTDLSYEEIVFQLQEILSTEITDHIDEVVFMKLIRLDENNRKLGKDTYLRGLENILQNGVRIENIQTAKEEMTSIIKYSSLKDEVKDVLTDLVDFSIVENSFFDVEKTMEARKEAASNVDPVVIRSGDIIVREGQIITNEIYEELKLVGLLHNERKIYPGIGLAFFIIMVISVIGYELIRLYNKNELDKRKILSIIIISLMIVTLMKIGSLFSDQLSQYYLLIPVATGVLLLKLLINERISIVFAVVFSLLGSIIFNGEIPGALNIEAGIYFLFFQLAGIISLTNIKDKVTIIKTALVMSIINIMSITMFVFLSFEKYEMMDLIVHVSFGISAAILSAVLTIGLLPFFETGLGLLSDGRLLSLANPNQPLLRKILTEAPGTYHHSVMVANLSESACEAIGANGLLARVGSYYHDIGKTLQPHYFIENQVAIRNPHDFIDPKQSAEIIISHATEGARMLKEHRFPKDIIDIALQHHGTSLIEYFYYMEKQQNENVNELDFRYPGPKPKTKEAGVISICDATEAAVRSLKEPSPEKIEEIVTSIVNHKLMDGQLDETPLTLEELHIIRETVCEALKGIFHSRIQYPTEEAN